MPVNNLSLWSQGVPLVLPGADNTFSLWSQGVPLVALDESNGTEVQIRGSAWVVSGSSAHLSSTVAISIFGTSISFTGSAAAPSELAAVTGTAWAISGAQAYLANAPSPSAQLFADRRASAAQPQHRQLDFSALDWFERKVSARQPRRRHLKF